MTKDYVKRLSMDIVIKEELLDTESYTIRVMLLIRI